MSLFEAEIYSLIMRDSGWAWFQIFSRSLTRRFADIVNAGVDAVTEAVDSEELSLPLSKWHKWPAYILSQFWHETCLEIVWQVTEG
jgi:hypothetical protein